MNKKSQITVFVIIGLVLVISAVGIYLVTSYVQKAPVKEEFEKILPLKLDQASLKTLVHSCIKTVSEEPIEDIGFFGGSLDQTEVDFIFYNNTKFRKICTRAAGYDKCINDIMTRYALETELAERIKRDVSACLDVTLTKYEDQGYRVARNDMAMDVNVKMGIDDLTVSMVYPITMSLKGDTASVSDYSVRLRYPLGRIYDLVVKILNSELSEGYFDQVEWMVNHSSEIKIEQHRPYPHIVYSLSKYDSQKGETYYYNFALEGIDTVSKIAEPPLPTTLDNQLGCCFTQDDGNCFENSPSTACSDNKGEWEQMGCKDSSFPHICNPRSEELYLTSTDCEGDNCRGCGDVYREDRSPGPHREHGESWCNYDAIAGRGRDLVGTRHYVHYCIDGKEYVEECRDFREEICVGETDSDTNLRKAMCRPNRWQDCFKQTSKGGCEDSDNRDCYWSDDQDQIGDTIYYNKQTRKCVPYVPPGFKFWTFLDVNQVCAWATDMRYCDQFDCPKKWSDYGARYCRSLGDCGNYRNVMGEFTEGGFLDMNMQNIGSNIYYTEDVVGTGLRYNIDLPLFPENRDQVPIPSDNYFVNPGHEITDVGDLMTDYGEWLQDIDIFDTMVHFITHGTITFKIPGIQFCSVWLAPDTVTSRANCEECNDNPFRPCTEYKCRSIGGACAFEVNPNTGMGECSFADDDSIAPIIYFNEQKTLGYELESTFVATMTGYRIVPELTGDYTFTVNTSEPTQCKLTMAPTAFGYGFSPVVLGTNEDFIFRTEHTFTIPYDTVSLFENVSVPAVLLNIGLPLNVDNYWELMLDQKEDFDDAVDDIEDDCDLIPGCDDGAIDDLQSQVNDMFDQADVAYQTQVKPVADAFLATMGDSGLEELFQQLTTEDYNIFVKCRDKGGNPNIGDFDFIQFRVTEPIQPDGPGGEGGDLPVDIAPLVSYINPEHNTTIVGPPLNQSVLLYVNEFSECKYDVTDTDYDSMSYEFDCGDSIYDSLFADRYLCKADISFTTLMDKIFIRCKDHPVHDEKYALTFERASIFSVADGDPNDFDLVETLSPRGVGINDAFVIEVNRKDDTKINVDTDNVAISMLLRDESECRYSDTDTDFSMMNGKMSPVECDNCSAVFPVTGVIKYNIVCHSDISPKNVMDSSFVYQLHNASASS